MSLREMPDRSIAIYLFKRCYGGYRNLAQRISYIYNNSQTNARLNKLLEKTNVCFKYSFLGRITEIKQADQGTLDNSRTVQFLVNFYKNCKDKIILYSKISETVDLAKDIKGQLNFSPLRIVGAILIATVLANTALAFILHSKISIWGCLIRGLFLFCGLAGLFCKADWHTVRETSVFLGKMRMN